MMSDVLLLKEVEKDATNNSFYSIKRTIEEPFDVTATTLNIMLPLQEGEWESNTHTHKHTTIFAVLNNHQPREGSSQAK